MAKCFTLTLLQDPALTGDLLLFAIALAEVQQTTEYLTTKKWEPSLLNCLGWDHHRLRGVIHKDVPRYEPDLTRYGCAALLPVAKRRCGRGVGYQPRVYTSATGEWEYFPACSQHRDGVEKIARASRIDWERAGSPLPAPNKGGALIPYFTNIEHLYEQVSPGYRERYSEGATRPKLQLLRGGAR